MATPRSIISTSRGGTLLVGPPPFAPEESREVRLHGQAAPDFARGGEASWWRGSPLGAFPAATGIRAPKAGKPAANAMLRTLPALSCVLNVGSAPGRI